MDNSQNNESQPKKNYLIQEQRDEKRISFWIKESTTEQEAENSVHMAWHSTWLVGEISDDDYRQFIQLCETHNENKNYQVLRMFDNPQIDKFLKRCELKSKANSLKSKLSDIHKELEQLEQEIKKS